jgi:hypothetical protein
MRPRVALGEADLDQRRAEQRRAVDVEHAGDRQVRLEEQQLALPREVRVRDEQAAPVGGALGADRPAIARRCVGAAEIGRRGERGLLGP